MQVIAIMRFRLRLFCTLFLLLTAGKGTLFSATLEEGRELFRKRKLDDAIRALHTMKDSLPPEKRREASELLAQCYWTKATHYTDDSDTKFELFEKGLSVIEEALVEFGEEASFYYWKAIFLGERTNVRFSLDSLGVSDMMRGLCQKAIALDPAYMDGGSYLVLGRLYYKLPKLFGGSAEESVKYLLLAKKYVEMKPLEERAHTVYLFLAESYIALKEFERARLELETGLKCPKNRDAPHEDEADYREMARLLFEVNQRIK
jgi:tetratricopeptide (TPR) repeat protein